MSLPIGEKSRIQQINETLMGNVKQIYKLRKIWQDIEGGKPRCAYVASLARCFGHTAEDQARLFYEQLQATLTGKECLLTENKCFTVVSNEFEAVYCVELWRKNADKIAYVQDGKIVIEQIYRMSCEQASAVFRKHKLQPLKLLSTMEEVKEYQNPADKYTALAKSSLLQRAMQVSAEKEA